MKSTSPEPARHWTFLSNHAHVLACIALDRSARLRDVAARVGITERAVQKIVADLEQAGVIERQRAGRRNSYRLHGDAPLRHPLDAHRTVDALLGLIVDRDEPKRAGGLSAVRPSAVTQPEGAPAPACRARA